MNSFHSCGKLTNGGNALFITLITKTEDPQGLEEYMPISLMENVYNIISKILSKRMQKVLHKIIDQKQFTFIENRGLLDSVVLVNEVVNEVRRIKGKCTIIKVDLKHMIQSIRNSFCT